MKKLNMNKTTRQNYLTYGLVIVAFVIIQIFMGAIPATLRGMLVPICAYVIMAISLNLTVGVLGELSLGHAGFMSVGAFTGTTVAIMLQDVVPSGGLRLLIAVVVATLFGALAGFLIGVPVLRLQGDYLAIVTLAFGEIIKSIFNNLYLGMDSEGLHASLLSDKTNLAEDGKMLINGPMGIGVLYGKKALLNKMPPFMSGGEMIESVTREGAVYAELPHKFEAGTVNAAGAAGLQAAIEYIKKVGFDVMQRREAELTASCLAAVKAIPHINVLGSDKPEEHIGIVNFTVDGVHPHDVSEILASDGVDVRAGHHCAQPLLTHLGYSSTVRASLAFYNDFGDIDRLAASLSTLRERMGYGK